PAHIKRHAPSRGLSIVLRTIEKPQVFKDVVVVDPVYLQGENADGVYAQMLLNFKDDRCAVHLSVFRWGAGVLKEMKKDWERVKVLCRERGCVELVAINPEETDKWYMFLRYFGFTEYKNFRVYSQEV
ncbi:MAG: hypothetical protein KAJ19_26910, partial [Gammaproteobacteria bacterium]|nr:hypothetical protein [Gammaproteobacteria bacterium]